MVDPMQESADHVALLVVGNCYLEVVVSFSGDEHVLSVKLRMRHTFNEGHSQEDGV